MTMLFHCDGNIQKTQNFVQAQLWCLSVFSGVLYGIKEKLFWIFSESNNFRKHFFQSIVILKMWADHLQAVRQLKLSAKTSASAEIRCIF